MSAADQFENPSQSDVHRRTVSLQVMSRLVRLAQGVYAVHAHWLSIQLRYDKESHAHVARVQKSASRIASNISPPHTRTSSTVHTNHVAAAMPHEWLT
jgi:hypothetical protein